jgi:hypothetical protein
MDGAYKAKDEVVEAVGAQALLDVEKYTGLLMSTSYPALRVGDLVPAFGSLYRVDKIVDAGQPKGAQGKDWLSMSPVKPEEIPATRRFQQGSIAIILGNYERGGYTGFNGPGSVVVSVAGVIEREHGDNSQFVAKIRIMESHIARPPSPRGTSVSTTTETKVRSGDTITIDKHPLTVRNIVPRDEKRHIVGWIELDARSSQAPATGPKHEAAPKGTVRDLASTIPHRRSSPVFPTIVEEMVADAEIGTDPAFDKVAKEQRLRAGTLIPSGLRNFLASWTGYSIERANVGFGLRGGEVDLTWNFYLVLPDEPHGPKASITQRLLKEAIAGPQTQPLSAYLRDMTEKYAATGAAPKESVGPFLRITRHTVEEVAFLEGVTQRLGDRKWSTCLDWTLSHNYRGEAPTFAKLLTTFPWLRSPALEQPFFDNLKDCPVFAYDVKIGGRFSDWMAEVPESATPGLESLLKVDGFLRRDKAVELKPPFWPRGTEQRSWHRNSDWTDASVIPLSGKKHVQFIFQSPQKPSAGQERN